MRGRYLILGIVAILGLVAYAQMTDDEPAAADLPRPTRPLAATQTPESVAVTYIVTTSRGNQKVSLTYENETGGSEQLDTVTTDGQWTKSFITEPGAFAYLSVQNREDAGAVTCEIRVNGEMVEQAESSGAFVIATCSGVAR